MKCFENIDLNNAEIFKIHDGQVESSGDFHTQIIDQIHSGLCNHTIDRFS